MKAPPRKSWPPAGTQIKLTRLDGTGAGLRRFVGIVAGSLLTSSINSDAVGFVALAELKSFEVVNQDGRPAHVWGA